MAPISPRDRSVLLALFGGLAVAFVARIHLGNLARDVHGPVRFASSADMLWAHVDGELWRLSNGGALLERMPVGKLGFGPKLSEMQALGDGSLLLGDLSTGQIHRCEPRGWRCTPLPLAGPPEWREHFGFHHDPSSGLTYIADTHDHRLLVDDGQVRRLASAAFEFPNAVHLDADGVLRIVDTNNHRIAAFEPGAAPRPDAAATIDTGWGSGRRRNPIAYSRDGDGRIWSLIGRADLARGYLVVHGAVEREIELPDPERPASLVWHGGSMIVGDMAAFRIHSVDPGSYQVRPFGDDDVRRALDASRARKARHERASSLALLATGVCAFALLVFALALQRRVQGVTARSVSSHVRLRDGPVEWEPRDAVPGVTWVRWSAASYARRSVARVSTVLIVVTAAGLGLYLYGVSRYTGIESALATFRAALFSVGLHFALDALEVLRASRTRIGSDGRDLVVETRGAPLRVPLAEVEHDDELLLAGGRAVRLGRGGSRWFDEASLTAVIGERLDPQRRLSRVRKHLRLLVGLNPSALSAALSIGVVLASLVARFAPRAG